MCALKGLTCLVLCCEGCVTEGLASGCVVLGVRVGTMGVCFSFLFFTSDISEL